ncbi:hypothetical protein HETIRDRAFT_442104 [Heterobasidion irregulare TC 32-1]|uniref:Uncharacterized protein n=1 Tax=Heterobasidion irregulare (strain TC 32-1) TaxID=747525 RepID=W4JT03_HETIT|nr:uncharacterized protein HETIRDRAFT_442104 [Heterobasidion irregulare TC 32-1]ETW76692.1 hypothetical protein HETIRDRAFT_442104 [Heterobasidion irregulare TC 32-1]
MAASYKQQHSNVEAMLILEFDRRGVGLTQIQALGEGDQAEQRPKNVLRTYHMESECGEAG